MKMRMVAYKDNTTDLPMSRDQNFLKKIRTQRISPKIYKSLVTKKL